MPKKRKDGKKNPLEEQYKDERKRIKRQLKALEKRGYVLLDEDTYKILPNIPQRIQEGSVRKLKKITLEKIYKTVHYIDPETGVMVSGKRGRQIEREKSAEKAKRTRKIRKEIEEELAEEEEYEEQHPPEEKADEYEDGWGWYEPDYEDVDWEAIHEGDDIIDSLYDAIDKWTPSLLDTPEWKEIKRGRVQTAKTIIDSAINTYGRNQVAINARGHADELTTIFEKIAYGSDQPDEVAFELARFAAILYGRSLTMDESKEIVESAEGIYHE